MIRSHGHTLGIDDPVDEADAHIGPVAVGPRDRVRPEVRPVDVLAVDRHAFRQARPGDVVRADIGAVDIRAADRVGRQVGPVDVLPVRRQALRRADPGDESPIDAGTVGIGPPDRLAAAGIGPVDVRIRAGSSQRQGDKATAAAVARAVASVQSP